MLKEVYFNEMSQTEGEFELWDWSRDTYVCMYVTALLGPEAGRDRELLATWVKLFHVSDPLLTMTSFWSFLSFATSYTVLGERWIFTCVKWLDYVWFGGAVRARSQQTEGLLFLSCISGSLRDT